MAASKARAQSEWHLWFAWYPVVVWVEGKPSRVWLQYVQRKLGISRITQVLIPYVLDHGIKDTAQMIGTSIYAIDHALAVRYCGPWPA
jgi:hypothetical protein